MSIKKRDDVNPNEGIKKYGKVEFADNINNNYPIDTEEHIRAAWRYVHMGRNEAEYDREDLDILEEKIIKAWKEKINSEGPPYKRGEK